MLWVFFAFLTPILWSFNSVMYKILLKKIGRNPFSFFILLTLVHLPLILILAFIFNPVFDITFVLLSILSSTIGNLGLLTYMFALQREDASKVVPLSNLNVIFILILAFIFLQEVFSLSKYFGISLILAGAIILSYKNSKGKFHFTPALSFVIANAFLVAVSTIIDKFILQNIDFWSRYVWGAPGGIIISSFILLMKEPRKDFLEMLKLKKVDYAVSEINNLFGMGGLIFWFMALSMGPATLVSAIAAIGPLITLVITTVLSVFLPNILKEEIDRKNMAIRVLGIFSIIIGSIITVV